MCGYCTEYIALELASSGAPPRPGELLDGLALSGCLQELNGWEDVLNNVPEGESIPGLVLHLRLIKERVTGNLSVLDNTALRQRLVEVIPDSSNPHAVPYGIAVASNKNTLLNDAEWQETMNAPVDWKALSAQVLKYYIQNFTAADGEEPHVLDQKTYDSDMRTWLPAASFSAFMSLEMDFNSDLLDELVERDSLGVPFFDGPELWLQRQVAAARIAKSGIGLCECYIKKGIRPELIAYAAVRNHWRLSDRGLVADWLMEDERSSHDHWLPSWLREDTPFLLDAT